VYTEAATQEKTEKPMAQQWKLERVNQIKEELKDYINFIFTNYRGLNVGQINSLRNTLREKGAEYHVVKNRYIKRVFEGMGHEELGQFLVDPTALVYTNKDISEVAKVLIDTTEDTTLELKGGFSRGLILSAGEIEKIAKLPSRHALIAQTLGLLNAPLNGLVFALGDIPTRFVRTLKAIEEAKRS
jgi:large subunit ribosomal protein L10